MFEPTQSDYVTAVHVRRAGDSGEAGVVVAFIPSPQFRPPIAFRIDLSLIKQQKCGKYQSCGWCIDLTYDYIAPLFLA